MDNKLFAPLTMFVCTFEFTMDNIKCGSGELIKKLTPFDEIKALNCNFGHKTQVGYEKFKKDKKREKKLCTKRPRKPQGDAMCFKSAIEAIVTSPT